MHANVVGLPKDLLTCEVIQRGALENFVDTCGPHDVCVVGLGLSNHSDRNRVCVAVCVGTSGSCRPYVNLVLPGQADR